MAKTDFDTIRDLERKGYRLFRVAGIMGIAGLLLMLLGLGIFTPLGVLLLLAAFGTFLYGMLWMLKLQKEPVRTLYCPYCASKNEVFKSRRELDCDICGRRIGVEENGEPIPLEPMDEEED